MHPLVYRLFTKNIHGWVAHRKKYVDPLDRALSDIFIFSQWEKDDGGRREQIVQSLKDGWIELREHVPSASIDLIKLTEKGKDFVRTKLDFDEL